MELQSPNPKISKFYTTRIPFGSQLIAFCFSALILHSNAGPAARKPKDASSNVGFEVLTDSKKLIIWSNLESYPLGDSNMISSPIFIFLSSAEYLASYSFNKDSCIDLVKLSIESYPPIPGAMGLLKCLIFILFPLISITPSVPIMRVDCPPPAPSARFTRVKNWKALCWSERSVDVHPGELTTVMYEFRNVQNRTIAAQAIPSYAPMQAMPYFNKLECFCFNEYTLKPGEAKQWPVVFVIDPKLSKDVKTITLSYTFFEVGGKVPAAPEAAAKAAVVDAAKARS